MFVDVKKNSKLILPFLTFTTFININLIGSARIKSEFCEAPPLRNAIELNDLALVKDALKGTNVNSRVADEDRALHYAIKYKCNEDIIKLLIDSKANVNAFNMDLETPTTIAAQRNRFDVIRLLINSKADINKANMGGRTALANALFNGHLDNARLLIDNAAEISSGRLYGMPTSLLIICIYVGANQDGIKLLIDEGADVNSVSPLSAAISSEKISADVIKLLIDAGTDPDKFDPVNFDSPLRTAISEKKVEVVKILLEAGADISIKNTGHLTPLELASFHNSAEIVALLKKESIKREEILKKFRKDVISSIQSESHIPIINIILDYFTYRDTLNIKPYRPYGQNRRFARVAQRKLESIKLIESKLPTVIAKIVSDYANTDCYWDIPKEDRLKHDIEDGIYNSPS